MNIKFTYRNPLDLATNSLRAFKDKAGKIVVVHSMHAGEDIAPNVYRFDAIGEARKKWVQLRMLIHSRGYTEKVD